MDSYTPQISQKWLCCGVRKEIFAWKGVDWRNGVVKVLSILLLFLLSQAKLLVSINKKWEKKHSENSPELRWIKY